MNEETERDTWQRTDKFINRLSFGGRTPLRVEEQRDLELLLRRYRKLHFGSALTDTERAEGRSEINP